MEGLKSPPIYEYKCERLDEYEYTHAGEHACKYGGKNNE